MKARRTDPGLLFQTACVWEATARKAGNVHPQAAFADVEYVHFLLSAAAASRAFSESAGRSVGSIVLQAVQATRAVTSSNTNLGIILLLSPLAVAELAPDGRIDVSAVLSSLTREDARQVYEAIRLANPGGLGQAPEQDVHEEPTVTLREAMAIAAGRDRIAYQYAHDFVDVFEFGVPSLLAAFARFGSVEAAIVESQLRWLAEFPDTLIARKNGQAVAEDVRRRAFEVLRRGGLTEPEGRRAWQNLDQHLRADGHRLNPGATADLIAACLFVALRQNRMELDAPFQVPSSKFQVPSSYR